MWTGPEPELEQNSFVDQTGEGTWVQKWSRVLQASKLAASLRAEAKNGGGWFGGRKKGGNGGDAAQEERGKPVKMRKPIRPSDEELEEARRKEGRVGAAPMNAEARMAAG